MGQFSVAKYDLGKVRLKSMQSAVSPLTVRDLRGSPLETCRAAKSPCITLTVLLAELCGSFALCFGKSMRILAPSPPLPFGCWVLGKCGLGKLFPLIIKCDGAS